MRRSQRLTAHVWITLLLIFLAAGPALAQPTADKETSAFQMFFWVPGDLFGLLQIWVLILMSVWVSSLVIQHAMKNKRRTFLDPDTMTAYSQLLDDRRYSEAIERASTDPTMFGTILHACLSEASHGYGAMERAVEEAADLASSKRSRALELLSVLGAVGPMVGLFGTVYGMIVAFYSIVDVGGSPEPAELAGGIATALVTTFWGLIVGIPAVAAVALFRAKIDGLTVESMIEVEKLISRFRPSRKANPAPAPRPAPRAVPTGA